MDYSALAKKEFPFAGEFFLSRTKKHDELIFFVPFYGGVKKQLLRHIHFVNQLGYDAFAFELEGNHKDWTKLRPPISSQGHFGIKHLYADQIERLLNDIPGKKIIFSFSNPGGSAFEAMARRQCSDTVAMICDSGPTDKFLPSVVKLLEHELKVKALALRLAITLPFALFWSPYFHKDLHTDLATFPEGFPLLSIRGWKDQLIPPAHIDSVFEPHTNLDWQKLSLPEAEHLKGLRDFKDDYQPVVEKFLIGISAKEKAKNF